MGDFLQELWAFMKERKKFWLLPIILVLVLLGSLIVLTQGQPWRLLFTRCFKMAVRDCRQVPSHF